MHGILLSCLGWCSSCYLKLLDKLQKTEIQDCWSCSCRLSWTLLSSSKSLFYRYYFGRYSSGLAELVPLPYSRGRSTRYSDRLHDFSVTIPRCYKDAYASSFFPPTTARLWNSLPIECCPLTYDLSGFRSRIKSQKYQKEKIAASPCLLYLQVVVKLTIIFYKK